MKNGVKKVNDINPFQYNGTSGSVPRDTSVQREQHERETGKTSLRAERFMGLLENSGAYGLTWRDLQTRYRQRYGVELHHGQISGMLSNLHKDGSVFTTTVLKRQNCLAYLPFSARHWFADEQRHDYPAQTKAGIRKDALEQVLFSVRILAQRDNTPDLKTELQNLILLFDMLTEERS